MTPASFYHHCPRCGARQEAPSSGNVFNCRHCHFRLYFNPASAVAVFITRADGRVLFIVRAKDPGRGKLAPPGGFIDFGESAEAAVHREIQEEVGLKLQNLRFICSHPNAYLFGGVTYPVLDLFFSAEAAGDTETPALEEVSAVHWLNPARVDPESLAFPSMQFAFRQWLAAGSRPTA